MVRPGPQRIFIEFQWDPAAGVIRMQASTGFGPDADYNRITRPVANLEEAQEQARQFVHLYRYCGSTVVTDTQELAPYVAPVEVQA